MDTWPIRTRTLGEHTLLGIPDRCGNAEGAYLPQGGPCLEEVGGEDWSAVILRRVLPAEQPWVWRTMSDIYRKSGLRAKRAPDVVSLPQLQAPVVRRSFLSPSALVVIPPDATAQGIVLDWTGGIDTEMYPDHLWTAPPHLDWWDLHQIAAWCKDPARWGNPASIPEQPADVVVTVFDDQISCALPSDRAAGVQAALAELARRWGLRIIAGDPRYAWASPRPR